MHDKPSQAKKCMELRLPKTSQDYFFAQRLQINMDLVWLKNETKQFEFIISVLFSNLMRQFESSSSNTNLYFIVLHFLHLSLSNVDKSIVLWTSEERDL